jgi:DNA-binding NtrC family response regulator
MSRRHVCDSGLIWTGAALALAELPMSRQAMFDARSVAGVVRAAIDRAGPGPAVADIPIPWRDARDVVADTVRACGLVPVDPGHLRARGERTGALRHRHVALVVTSPQDTGPAAEWVKSLARASPRGHVVLRFAEGRAAAAPACDAAADDVNGRRDDRRLVQLVAALVFERAEAWLAALRAEAWLFGRPCRDDTLRAATWLRLWQGRLEEAAGVCGELRHAASRRRLEAIVARQCSSVSSSSPSPAGLARWTHGVAAMFLLPAIPTLLQVVADAEDELTALRGAAVWAQHHAGAHGVAFVGADDGRLAAADGWTGHGPSPADRLLAAQACAPGRHDRGPLVLNVAPVRHAGAQIGGVLVLGPVERAATLAEATTTLALLCASALRLRLDQWTTRQQGRALLPEIIGDSPAATAMRDAVARAATTPFAVLVEGDSGTGKELVARALHRLSPRRDRRFVAVNCAALSDELIEAELFGHTRGAFTGAVAPRAGLFEDAHGGTLFLDEVAELSARAQAKLLRVLQEREVRRVGENVPRPIDVRVVAATNRPLADACASGQFRDDLLFRLAVVRIRLAPLRDRAEDIAPIARALWLKTMREVGKRAVLGADALARMASHRWPGNVRELQNVIAGLALLAPVRGRVSSRHVDLVLATAGAARHAPPMSLERARRACERQTVAAALARHAGRRTAAARELGLTRQGLAKIIRRLHIEEGTIEGVA